LWRRRDRHYRAFLAEAWLEGRDEGFWSFHRKGLATVGATIDRSVLLRDAARAAIRTALSPARIIELVRARRRSERDH